MIQTKDIKILKEDYLTDEELAGEDKETRDFIKMSERGELVPNTDPEFRNMLIETAHNTPISRKSITLKLRTPTYNRLRTIAAKEGVPYQTLMNSVLMKYTEGRLVEKK
ncbi:MAG: hypothetical protein PHN60_02085 [Candidatus Gracilibacteria bacterium]|nr:hypothetical protein [Candidatus Gracilibacteria bacterium]